jgi:hypothetical protein
MGCKATPQNSLLTQITTEEFGKDAVIEFNVSKTFALIHKVEQGTTSYAIIQVTTQKVIYRKIKIRAEVTWSDDLQIKETYRPEIVTKDGTGKNSIILINIKDYLVQTK